MMNTNSTYNDYDSCYSIFNMHQHVGAQAQYSYSKSVYHVVELYENGTSYHQKIFNLINSIE